MKTEKQKKGNFTIIKVIGKLDTTSYNQLNDELDELVVAGENNILIDCSEISYISSSGLRVLLIYLKKLTSAEGKFYLCNMPDSMEEIFNVSGFKNLFKIFDSSEEALSA